MKKLMHRLFCKQPTEIAAKTYREHLGGSEGLLEITQYLIRCQHCGATWIDTLYGKEVAIWGASKFGQITNKIENKK